MCKKIKDCSHNSFRIGGILAPFIIGIKPVAVPLFIMGFSCLVGGVIAVFLPETLGAPLPETLEDVRYFVLTAYKV